MALDWSPLVLSAQIATLATLVDLVLGILVGWCLARRQFPGRDLLSAAVAAPLVLPPTVLGYYLLVALGRSSFIGQWLGGMGQSCQAALDGVDEELEQVARTLGRSELEVFWTITLPLAWRGILAGTMLAFARALGDFGATLMVAGNIPGRTQTLSIAIYDAVQANDLGLAGLMAVILTAVAIGLLLLMQRVGRWLAA